MTYYNKGEQVKNSIPLLYGTISGALRRYVDNTVEFVAWLAGQREEDPPK
jgi:hypothetical protein